MQNQSKWVSVCIFHEISFEKVIIELIKPIIKDLESKEFLSSYFFIRYWENGSHLRLRVLPKNDIDRDNIISTISVTTESYFKKDNQESLYHIEFTEYIREIERYGGDRNIEHAEIQFKESTKVVINLINKNYSKWDYSLAISYAIQMHIILAKSLFESDKNSMIDFFQKIYSNWFYYSVKLNESEKILEDEISKVKLFFENSYLNQKVKINSLVSSLIYNDLSTEWLNKWFSECKIISKAFINKSDNIEQLYSIFESFIHMTNNRFGIHLRDESFIAYLIYNSLDDLSNYANKDK